jgi:RNA polymerase sigma factor (sigma-70 family)
MFDEAYPRLYATAYRVAFRILGRRAEAEDAAAEACARAYASWWRVNRYAVAWVAKVASNLAIDAVRRGNRDRGLAAEPGPDPHVEDRLDLQRALRALPRRQREVVVLRYLADLPEDAVAVALGCSVGTVTTHGSRGLAALRAGSLGAD